MKQSKAVTNSALLRFPQVSRLVGLSRTKLTQLEKQGKFPKRIALGNRLVVWKESDLERFCDDPAGYLSDSIGIGSIASSKRGANS